MHKNRKDRTSSNRYVEILELLLKQFKPIDFELLKYPHEVKMIRNYLKYFYPGDEKTKDPIKRLDELKRKTKTKTTRDDYLIAASKYISAIAGESPWDICEFGGFVCIHGNEDFAEIKIEEFKIFLGKASEKMSIPEFTAKHHLFCEQLYKQFFGSYKPRYYLSKMNLDDSD